jgi:hypothetical protein
MWNNISNFAAIIANKMVRTKLNNLDLLPLGARDESYDGNYKDAAILPKDLVNGALPLNTAHYELDITDTNIVTVNTTRGIIDIIGMGSEAPLTPDAAFGSSTAFYINNPELDLTSANRDNVYVQYSVYYSQNEDDNAIPYLISTGIVNPGLEFNLYNTNPATALVKNWQGALYVYYELYQIN